MKRVATWATVLMFLLSGTAGAFILKPDDNFANQNAVNRGANGDVFVRHATETGAKWFDAKAASDQKAVSSLQLKGNSDLIEPPQDDSGLTKDFSVSEPVASSSGPAPTEAPMPRAGWIGLAGVLGVMAARWFSAARRSRAKSAAG
jgi:hypothetical protein